MDKTCGDIGKWILVWITPGLLGRASSQIAAGIVGGSRETPGGFDGWTWGALR